MTATHEQNRLEGKSFEEIIKSQGHRCGLLVKPNKLTAKFIPGGRTLLEKSNLDFMLANQMGKVGFFDAKSFAGSSFGFSDINEHQLEKAVLYNEYRIPAGFLVFFRAEKAVSFFSGKHIQKSGPGTSMKFGEGIYLGQFWSFDLGLVLTLDESFDQLLAARPVKQGK